MVCAIEHMVVKIVNYCAFEISVENLNCTYGDTIFHHWAQIIVFTFQVLQKM